MHRKGIWLGKLLKINSSIVKEVTRKLRPKLWNRYRDLIKLVVLSNVERKSNLTFIVITCSKTLECLTIQRPGWYKHKISIPMHLNSTSHCFSLMKWGVSNFETANPRNLSTFSSSFSFWSHITFLLSAGSLDR